jgi:alcohol dehydrogenase class IV
VEGMRLIKEWLPAACVDGSNLEARGQMLVASTMGATAFQKGLGAMHSLSHPCSANLDTHHGLTNGVVMPYVLVFNRRAIKDKMKRLASYLGLKRPSFGAVLDWVVELRSTIGIPNTLAELGVTEEHISGFAKMAMADPSTPSNPLKLSVRKFETLYRNAITGKI